MTTYVKAAAVALALGASIPAFAEDAHHPQGATQAQSAPAQPSAQPMRPGMGSGGMGMMGHGGMMGGDMMGSGMMPMMGMMQMMHGGGHIDGRLAFIKTELKITDAQEKAWSDFAAALRQAAAKTPDGHSRMRMMSGMAGNVTPPQLLEHHEKQLAAHLEAIRIVKPALANLHAALSDEQKQTLAQLHPMFIGMM